MAKSKNFNLLLMDGDVTGRIKCTLANWTGVAYKIPRIFLDDCRNRKDLKQSGVYFLFYKNNNNEDEVYIGQAGIRKNGEGVLCRVSEHLKETAYFYEVVILTTQNNSFGPTEISYLEHYFTRHAHQINRYKIRNSNEPNSGNVTEEKAAELEEFIEYSKMVLGVLGYKLFVPIVNFSKSMISNDMLHTEQLLSLSRKIKKEDKIIESSCMRTNEGFVVLKGSMIAEVDSLTLPQSIKNLRQVCRVNKDIIEGRLIKDMLFSSPSYAAAFVLGMTTNGKVDWKDQLGRSLKQIEELGM